MKIKDSSLMLNLQNKNKLNILIQKPVFISGWRHPLGIPAIIGTFQDFHF